MAKNEIEKVLTVADEKRFNKFNNAIIKAYESTEKSMLTIAGSISVIANEKLYLTADFKNVYDYCQDNFGISRGSVSECIKVWECFGNMETGALQDRYSAYKFTQLKLMRKLTAEQLLNVNETYTTRELEELIKSNKAIAISEEVNASEEVHASEQESNDRESHEQPDNGSNETEYALDNELHIIKIDDTVDNGDNILQLIYEALSAGRTITFKAE